MPAYQFAGLQEQIVEIERRCRTFLVGIVVQKVV